MVLGRTMFRGPGPQAGPPFGCGTSAFRTRKLICYIVRVFFLFLKLLKKIINSQLAKKYNSQKNSTRKKFQLAKKVNSQLAKKIQLAKKFNSQKISTRNSQKNFNSQLATRKSFATRQLAVLFGPSMCTIHHVSYDKNISPATASPSVQLIIIPD